MYQEFEAIGNAVNSAEMRYTPSGVPVASFRMAINKQWTNANGEKQEKVLFVKVSAWRKLAEVMSQYLEKGRQVFVKGELEEPENWTDREGKQRSTIVITAQTIKLLGGKGSGNGHEAPAEAGQPDDTSVPF